MGERLQHFIVASDAVGVAQRRFLEIEMNNTRLREMVVVIQRTTTVYIVVVVAVSLVSMRQRLVFLVDVFSCV